MIDKKQNKLIVVSKIAVAVYGIVNAAYYPGGECDVTMVGNSLQFSSPYVETGTLQRNINPGFYGEQKTRGFTAVSSDLTTVL